MNLTDDVGISLENVDRESNGILSFRWNSWPGEGIITFSMYWQPVIGEWLNWEWIGVLDMQDFQDSVERGLVNGFAHKSLPAFIKEKDEKELLTAVQRRFQMAN